MRTSNFLIDAKIGSHNRVTTDFYLLGEKFTCASPILPKACAS